MPFVLNTSIVEEVDRAEGHVIVLRLTYPGRVRTPTRRIRADYPPMFGRVLRHSKPTLSCRGVVYQWTPAHMYGSHFHSWGSSGRRFKSCQPDQSSCSQQVIVAGLTAR
jgi:hypothetical protein